MDILINDLTVEDIIMISALFFAAVLGFSFGYMAGKGQ